MGSQSSKQLRSRGKFHKVLTAVINSVQKHATVLGTTTLSITTFATITLSKRALCDNQHINALPITLSVILLSVAFLCYDVDSIGLGLTKFGYENDKLLDLWNRAY